ncbi:cysteine desulfurase [Nocardia brasiliensis ATCC 700358]|uniref:cysteine desulfurase n=1 Tax=Nocardia brasiliensis (strain ATCC 700358 / HUJEG-1) TaxID=1133849 RepID=K0EHL6_NOCB7|nr:cysteine desulfurase [Nocardia brasiliensis ATCC 700358]
MRELLAGQLNAGPDELIFTSGATESNNIAILGLAPHGIATDRRHIIASAIEHKAVLEPLAHLESQGFDIDLVQPEPGGRISAEAVAQRLRPDTLLVSLMHVNNEIGTIQPVAELADLLRATPTYFHVDAAQGFGKLTADLVGPIDMISISGHKIGAPKGIGALLLRERDFDQVPLTPLMYGGGQEQGLRPGTLPVPLIAGLGKAAEIVADDNEKWMASAQAFRLRLLDALSRTRYHLNGDPDHTVPHIVNVSFDAVDAEALIVRLKNIAAVSTGSACTSASYTPSHVLAALNLSDHAASNGLRLSWIPGHVQDFDPEPLANAIREFQG